MLQAPCLHLRPILLAYPSRPRSSYPPNRTLTRRRRTTPTRRRRRNQARAGSLYTCWRGVQFVSTAAFDAMVAVCERP